MSGLTILKVLELYSFKTVGTLCYVPALIQFIWKHSSPLVPPSDHTFLIRRPMKQPCGQMYKMLHIAHKISTKHTVLMFFYQTDNTELGCEAGYKRLS